mmetsp:Transcript_24674/g.40641  ORF Transcript_24674/g.40641 Transcript_24674/m.40641 type:complete len:322 (+) Transcript_24674:22-987(+)
MVSVSTTMEHGRHGALFAGPVAVVKNLTGLECKQCFSFQASTLNLSPRKSLRKNGGLRKLFLADSLHSVPVILSQNEASFRGSSSTPDVLEDFAFASLIREIPRSYSYEDEADIAASHKLFDAADRVSALARALEHCRQETREFSPEQVEEMSTSVIVVVENALAELDKARKRLDETATALGSLGRDVYRTARPHEHADVEWGRDDYRPSSRSWKARGGEYISRLSPSPAPQFNEEEGHWGSSREEEGSITQQHMCRDYGGPPPDEYEVVGQVPDEDDNNTMLGNCDEKRDEGTDGLHRRAIFPQEDFRDIGEVFSSARLA